MSLPDDLFRIAETTARRLRVSRSQLYATALAEFLDRHQGESVTKRLDEIYSQRAAKVDPALYRAQVKSLKKNGG